MLRDLQGRLGSPGHTPLSVAPIHIAIFEAREDTRLHLARRHPYELRAWLIRLSILDIRTDIGLRICSQDTPMPAVLGASPRLGPGIKQVDVRHLTPGMTINNQRSR